MFEKTIFHIDVNSAFLSWEAVYRLKVLGGTLDLREIPSAVGGDMSMRHGIILAKSIPAKKYGIHTGQSIPEAKQKYRNLLIVPPNYGLYEKCSKAFMDILREYSPDVEQYSIDESFLDMTGTQSLFGEPVKVAHEMKDRIYNELGFTVNIGISSNKILAKMASDFKKPNCVHTLYPDEIREKMWHLPVSDLFFCGRATTQKLLLMGIKTIGELANTNVEILKANLKKHGEIIWAFANGIDFSVVQSETIPNKGYGNSTTISFDVTDASTAKMVLLALAETVCSRLRRNSVKAEVVSIGIKDCNLHYTSHQRVLISATNITNEIHKISCELFDELWDGTAIRHLGIHTSRIRELDAVRQFNMFDHTDYQKWESVDSTIDNIRNRFGIDSVKRASFALSKSIDHMSGGISREKRSVDYTKLKIE
ncbi:DNA polymerase Y family protein [Anaerosacchariphilus polymeriproducens]|uniref:DNA polymerase IV n=1 Tax=Anaerosacchariphilus polymeriproducens TaxID=1812858 RepID=A0A371AS10_9FIRM|nr:DNA polymerase IV [Anaerosacchariphilus polymeriproducens]RDU22347.1 DNA polymerase IV [Anaerosacchariphilus polymeriproducens]